MVAIPIGPREQRFVAAAIAGSGVIHVFEQWLCPHLDSGALEPVLQDG